MAEIFEEQEINDDLEVLTSSQKDNQEELQSIQELLDSGENQNNLADSFAENNGVMLAAEGTTQGKSGWYHDRQGNLVYWNIDVDGNWKRIDTELN